MRKERDRDSHPLTNRNTEETECERIERTRESSKRNEIG